MSAPMYGTSAAPPMDQQSQYQVGSSGAYRAGSSNMHRYNHEQMPYSLPQEQRIPRKTLGSSPVNSQQEMKAPQRQPSPLPPYPTTERRNASPDEFLAPSMPPRPDVKKLPNGSSRSLSQVSTRTSTRSSTSSDYNFKPCVVPQTSKTLHGACHRPFARAYAPDLMRYDITEEDFLTFIDGLNKAWLAHWATAAGVQVGNIIGFLPFVEAQVISWGMVAASEVGAFVISKKRTAAYLRTANDRLFRPRGLHAQVLLTPQMMETIGAPTTELKLNPVDEQMNSETDQQMAQANGEVGEESSEIQANDPRMRRLNAVKEYTMPMTFNSKLYVTSNNWFEKTNQAQEHYMAERQNKTLRNRREKGQKLIDQANEEANRIDGSISTLEKQMNHIQMAAEQKKNVVQMMAQQKKSGMFSLRSPEKKAKSEMAKIDKELNKDVGKLEKEKEKLNKEKVVKVDKPLRKGEKKVARVDKKEQRLAQKVMWIVISKSDAHGLWDNDMAGFDWIPDQAPGANQEEMEQEAQHYEQYQQHYATEQFYQQQTFPQPLQSHPNQPQPQQQHYYQS